MEFFLMDKKLGQHHGNTKPKNSMKGQSERVLFCTDTDFNQREWAGTTVTGLFYIYIQRTEITLCFILQRTRLYSGRQWLFLKPHCNGI